MSCLMHSLALQPARVCTLAVPAPTPSYISLRHCACRHPLRHRGSTFVARASDSEKETQAKASVPDAAPARDNGAVSTSGLEPPTIDEAPSTLPGEEKNLKLPQEVIERLKTTVFGFDTFWVTSVENYEGDGVLFQGNVRGKDPSVSYAKMKERLKNQLGDKYDLFLLEDKDDKPTVIVLPTGAGAETISRGQEVWLAVAFALGTVLTTVNAASVPVLEWLVNPFGTVITQEDWTEALPYIFATFGILGAHEFGHSQIAKKYNTSTYLPFFIPAGFGFLGSFGAITRLKGFLPNREALLEFGSQGPLYGTIVSGSLMLFGFLLSALGVVDIGVESGSFADSLLVAVAAQAFLGERLIDPIVQVNSLALAGWAGLLINALNCIPVGETDGGRIATALWGRRTASALSIWSSGALALGSLGSALAFYWIILVLVLQRGPVIPCNNEMTPPTDQSKTRQGIALLALPLLILLPYPVELIVALRDLGNTSYF